MEHLIDRALVPLFVPADRPDRYDKARQSGADAIILDLEDAVAENRKEFARASVLSHQIHGLPVIIRVNATRTTDFPLDVECLNETSFDAVMLPKVCSQDDVRTLEAQLKARRPIIPLIESAAGVQALRRLFSIDAVRRASFGAVDFALDVGCDETREALLYARSRMVMLSRAANRPAPLDSPSVEIDDLAEVTNAAAYAARLGFGGKLAIHPRQLPHILDGFRPDDETVRWATKILQLVDDARSGAHTTDGCMVDKPIVERARRILSIARA